MYIGKARDIGTRAFVSKDESTNSLVEIIKRVMDGHTYFIGLSDLELLTDREIEIVRLYCSGKNRKEVAAECYMSILSLATFLNRIYSKLGINNYQDLYKKALELGYLKIDFI